VRDALDLSGRVTVITGGAGLLGAQHAAAIAELGGAPVIADVDYSAACTLAGKLQEMFETTALAVKVDITDERSVEAMLATVLQKFGRVDALINNAANNPKVEAGVATQWSRLENFPLETWWQDLAVGLTGAFLCSKVVGSELAKRGKGVIINIASDLALIGPDQRIYRLPGLPEAEQPVKPVTYSVVKAGLLGLTRYLATYWADSGVRVNAICPGGVLTGQDDEFVGALTKLIPMGRMASPDEYRASIAFLLSDASSYMTGATLVVDGGRTCW